MLLNTSDKKHSLEFCDNNVSDLLKEIAEYIDQNQIYCEAVNIYDDQESLWYGLVYYS